MKPLRKPTGALNPNKIIFTPKLSKTISYTPGGCFRDTASETVRTLLVYGYVLDPPTGEAHEGNFPSFLCYTGSQEIL